MRGPGDSGVPETQEKQGSRARFLRLPCWFFGVYLLEINQYKYKPLYIYTVYGKANNFEWMSHVFSLFFPVFSNVCGISK